MVVRSETSWNVSRSPLATIAVPPAPLLGGDGGGEKIVGLVARRLGVGEAAGRDELRQRVELLEQRVVEFAAALVGRELPVPVGRRVERVPADQHGARLLGLVEPQQKIGEAEDGAGGPAAALRRIVFGSA